MSCYFSFDFLEKRSGVQPERKRVKAVVLGPESSDTGIKDAFKGKFKSVCSYKVGALSSGYGQSDNARKILCFRASPVKQGYYAQNYARLEV